MINETKVFTYICINLGLEIAMLSVDFGSLVPLLVGRLVELVGVVEEVIVLE